MFEKSPAAEPERAPSETEVVSLFKELANEKEFVEIRKLGDEKGLYLWDIRITNEQGETTEYSYMKKGRYREGEAVATAIHVTFYNSEDFPVGGHSVAKYINGEWLRT